MGVKMASKVGIPFWAVVVCSGVMLLGVTETRRSLWTQEWLWLPVLRSLVRLTCYEARQ